MILVSTGATDIGRKSVWDLAVATLGTGRITALFHCMGTTEVDKDRLNSWANCLLKMVLRAWETMLADCPSQWMCDAMYPVF